MKAENRAKRGAATRSDARGIAEKVVAARLSAGHLPEYPGVLPATLEAAYDIQDLAISMWPDELKGWKVGRIPPQFEDEFGCDRLAGPIFETMIRNTANGTVHDMPVFSRGFTAVEAEFVAVIGENAPPGKLDWSRDEAWRMIGDLCIGLEVASSPFPGINDFGPAVTASDFGNNAGLIVGRTIADWRQRDPETLTCRAFVDDELVGEGGAYKLTGGVTRSVQFMLELAARRGKPLQAGDVVATGQTSGIHEVAVGQLVRIEFGNDGELACKLVTAVGSTGVGAAPRRD